MCMRLIGEKCCDFKTDHENWHPTEITHYITLPFTLLCDTAIHIIQVSALFADVHELASYIFDVMKDHLLVFDLKKVSGVHRMESHLM